MGSILAFLLRLIADRPVHRLSGLPQAGRAFDEQPPYALSVFRPEPPKKEPLDDLTRPLLGLLRREEGGAGRWL